MKYLFVARFKDGTIYEQPENDISTINPNKSAFWDVLQLQRDGQNPVELFCLSDGQKDYLVDLRDGHFEVNGISLKPYSEDIPVYNRRLIYFRRKTILFNLDFDNTGETTAFHFGWQANASPDPASRNIQQIIEVT